MEQVLLIGVRDLPNDEMEQFVKHVMDPSHWAKKMKRKKPLVPPDLNAMRRQAAEASAAMVVDPKPAASNKRGADEENIAPDGATKKAKTDGEVVPTTALGKAIFVIPTPGMEGAQPGCLAGLRFVLTGVFPQVGGGTGLNMGKVCRLWWSCCHCYIILLTHAFFRLQPHSRTRSRQ